MTTMHGGDIAIVGAAETNRLGKLPGHSMLALHAEAARLGPDPETLDRRSDAYIVDRVRPTHRYHRERGGGTHAVAHRLPQHLTAAPLRKLG